MSNAHNPKVLAEGGTYYMFVIGWEPSVHTDLYKSTNLLDWQLVANGVLPTELNSVIKVNGMYYAYTTERARDTSDVYTSPNLTDFSRKAKGIVPGDDPGVYYEDGVFHLYFEKGEVECKNDGEKIGHATSSDGVHFTEQAPVIDSSDTDYDVGDPFVTKIGDTYHIIYDWNLDVSLDKIRHGTGKSPSNFDRGNIILTGRSNPGFSAVGDGWLVYADGRWNLFFEASPKSVWVAQQ